MFVCTCVFPCPSQEKNFFFFNYYLLLGCCCLTAANNNANNCFNVLSELGLAQRKFAQCLGEFHFEYIGDAKTDDEKCIGKCGLASSHVWH